MSNVCCPWNTYVCLYSSLKLYAGHKWDNPKPEWKWTVFFGGVWYVTMATIMLHQFEVRWKEVNKIRRLICLLADAMRCGHDTWGLEVKLWTLGWRRRWWQLVVISGGCKKWAVSNLPQLMMWQRLRSLSDEVSVEVIFHEWKLRQSTLGVVLQ